ncbi:Hypothetical protein A7982_00002 [Minicystis rosea]|nr:Hypothetical protein A7982_00002 [Minicystis rosea]
MSVPPRQRTPHARACGSHGARPPPVARPRRIAGAPPPASAHASCRHDRHLPRAIHARPLIAALALAACADGAPPPAAHPHGCGARERGEGAYALAGAPLRERSSKNREASVEPRMSA